MADNTQIRACIAKNVMRMMRNGVAVSVGIRRHSPEDIGVQNLSTILLRTGPMLGRLDELITEVPALIGVMGAVAEVGG